VRDAHYLVSVPKLIFCCVPGKHCLHSLCLRRRCFLQAASNGRGSEHLRSGLRLPSQKTKVGLHQIVWGLCTDRTVDIATKSRRKRGAGVATDEEGDADNLANGGISGTDSEGAPHRPPRPRTRPVRARAAKDKAPTVTSSSENDEEEEGEDAFGAKRTTRMRQLPARRSRVRQAESVAEEARQDKEPDAGTMDVDPTEELEPEDSVPLVLNGSPVASPSRGKKRPRVEEDEPEIDAAAKEDASNDVSKFPRRKYKKVKL
jgi:hypothetical protein